MSLTIAIAIVVAAYLAIGFLILVLYYCKPLIDDVAGIAVILFWPAVFVFEFFIGLDRWAKIVANFLR